MLTLPALVVLGVTVLFPLGWLVALSLQSFSASGNGPAPAFVGLENYFRIADSAQFQGAVLHTLAFVLVTLALEALFAFPAALSLFYLRRGSWGFRLLIALPLMVAPVVAAMAWRFLLADGYGLINGWLSRFGIEGPSWLGSPGMASLSVLVAQLWNALPFDVLVLLAGLVSLPHEPFEAARVDGARPWQVFRYLTLPLLIPSILIILVVRLADAFKVFDLIYLLTGGGPADATDVMSTYIYRLMFSNADFAGGAAAATMLTLITLASAGIAFALVRRWAR
jgi:multiple sugar transport system permease protein